MTPNLFALTWTRRKTNRRARRDSSSRRCKETYRPLVEYLETRCLLNADFDLNNQITNGYDVPSDDFNDAPYIAAGAEFENGANAQSNDGGFGFDSDLQLSDPGAFDFGAFDDSGYGSALDDGSSGTFDDSGYGSELGDGSSGTFDDSGYGSDLGDEPFGTFDDSGYGSDIDDQPLDGGGGGLATITITGITPDTGIADDDGITRESAISVFGEGDAGATFLLYVNAKENIEVTVDENGEWITALAEPLTEGEYTLEAVVYQEQQPVSVSSYAVEIDQTAPNVEITGSDHSPVPAAEITINLIDENDQAFEGSVKVDVDLNDDGDFDDVIDDVKERDHSEGHLTGSDPQEITLNPLPYYYSTVRARVTDRAGNEGESQQFLINVAIPFIVETEDDGQNPDGFGDPSSDGDSGDGGDQFGDVGGEQDGGDEPFGETGGGSGGGGKVLPKSGGGGASPATASEAEPNNNSGQANILNLLPNERLIVSGEITAGNDQDWFRFTLSARTGLFIDIDSRETGLSTTLDSNLTLFNVNVNTIENNNNGYDFDTGFPVPVNLANAASADSSIYRELNPGDYFVRVSSIGTTTGRYELILFADPLFGNTIPVLNSKPDAADTLYLDFDGHAATDAWGTYTASRYDINGNANEISPGERMAITNIWRIVTEDYSPFNINVTTVQPPTFTDGVAIRSIITNSNPGIVNQPNGTLGVAFIDSYAKGGTANQAFFGAFIPQFAGIVPGTALQTMILADAVEVGNTISHEMGHTVNLGHYGGTNPQPLGIMNASVVNPASRLLWRTGLTSSAEPPVMNQDDMAIISNTANTIGYRTDDHGNNQAGATVLTTTTTVYTASGVISEIAVDVDWFKFTVAGVGPTTIRVEVDDYVNDLDAVLNLYDSGGALLATANPTNSFDAEIIQTLPPGDYFICVETDGEPGEAGEYDIIITIPEPPAPPPPPPPPPPPGGGGGGSGPADDRFESNDTSDQASGMGTITSGSGKQSFAGLSINRKTTGAQDHDWFLWTAGESGVFTINLTNINAGGGDIHVRLYTLAANGTLVEIGSSTSTGGLTERSVSVNVTAGQKIYVYVFGFNFALGMYDLDAELKDS